MADVYARTRTDLIDLGATLDEEQLARPVAATPGWSVKDVYAHLCGVCADVLDGRMEGGGSPPWTAEQIRVRTDASFREVVAEWNERAPDVEELMRSSPAGPMGFLAFDVWTHGQDVRSTVGAPPVTPECTPLLAAAAIEVFHANFTREGTPATRVVTPTIDRVLGEGDPVATLRTDDHDLMRMCFGRRSRAQMEAAGWEGDYARPLDDLHLFDLPEHDLPV